LVCTAGCFFNKLRSECSRNLLIGINDTKAYGHVSKIGYFPDTFGIYGQAPQLLKQAGIDTAAFGRGVKPTGFNNTVSDIPDYESPYSEMIWKSPDGSGVLGILFANWYSNGNEIPVDEAEAKAFWDKKLQDAEKMPQQISYYEWLRSSAAAKDDSTGD
jgi:alpha-mannosidase